MKITILKDEEAENWKASRRKVVVDYIKRAKIDGINPVYRSIWTATAELGEII